MSDLKDCSTVGQHWATVRELYMKRDKELCDSWKDEVQNVLIFAGLFSAIVTAFLIESQKSLKPDPTVQLLTVIAQAVNQSYGAPQESRRESAVNIFVNAFWFLSLVLSLTTALVGIVSLQWIRTHLATFSSGAESLGISHMHSFGLKQSHIPLVFASLPVILILGLSTFLIGLVAFLFQLNWPVAIPISIAIMFTFTFLIISTAHPALQLLIPGGHTDDYPSPYRSPQSLLFLRLVVFLKQQRRHTNTTVTPNDAESCVQNPVGDITEGESFPKVDALDNVKDLSGLWMQTSQNWLRLRNRITSGQKPFAKDIIRALILVKESKSANSDKDMTALSSCLAQVLPADPKEFLPTGGPEDLAPFLADLVPLLPSSDYVSPAPFLNSSAPREVLSAVAFLQISPTNTANAPSPAQSHACIRTIRWLFQKPRTLDSSFDCRPRKLMSGFDKQDGNVIEILVATLNDFFVFAANYQPDGQGIRKTTYTSSCTYWFLRLSAEILNKSLSPNMQSRHKYALTVIIDYLKDATTTETHRDYLFITASIFCSVSTSARDLKDLLDAMKQYIKVRKSQETDAMWKQLWGALKASEVDWPKIGLERVLPNSSTVRVLDSSE